jgi:translation initiation factor IF-2
MTTAVKQKKQKVMSLIRETNLSKEDILKFLGTIGISDANLNTNLEPEIVSKVMSHFKRNIDEQDKHIKKVVDFAKRIKIGLSEADKKIKEQEEEKKRKEEEQRIQKLLEEENKRKEEEKRKQELMALIEREKKQEKLSEEQKKKQLEKVFEDKLKKSREAAEKKEKEKGKDEKVKPKETEIPKTKKKVEIPPAKKETPKPEIKKAPEVKPKTEESIKLEKQENERLALKKSKEHHLTAKKESNRISKPSNFQQRKPETRDFRGTGRPPFGDKKKEFIDKRTDKTVPPKEGEKKPEKPTYKKVNIKDLKHEKKKFFKDTPKKEGESKFKPSGETQGTAAEREFAKRQKEKKAKFEEEQLKKGKKKFAKGHRAKDIAQKEILEAIRDTFAKIDEDSGLSQRSLARRRKKKERLEQEIKKQELEDSQKNIIKVTEFISTAELANIMSIEPTEIIKKCFELGKMVSINQRLEKDLIELLAEEFGFVLEFQNEYEEDILKDVAEDKGKLVERPPVVTVMGHVDHGKTSLLDYVRKANVVAGEAGGITQHIGAYKVRLNNGKEITFLDTPGHEAFTAMRARGGQAADIVVLVVAADDSVMPQTVEAMNHALAAGVSIIIAINKVDKPDSNPEKIKQQLADKGLLVEEWGGKYQAAEISAKFGKNVDALLDKILLEAEILELRSDPTRLARGVVLEAKLDKGRGIAATVLIQKGTLKVGDAFIAGICSGRVKAMFDEREKKIEIALPATPVQLLGFDGMPQAGDAFIVLESERDVRDIALKRQQLKREEILRQVRFTTLDDISQQIKEGKQVELNIIIKADTDGSAEALADSLHKLTTKEAKVSVIHKALGQISESDVLLAEASKAIIIGFNARPNLNARKLAEKSKVDIRTYNIIYNVIDEVKLALEGLLEPEISEEVTATIEVRQVFKVPKVGNVAGCYVQDGKINRNNKVRLLRDGLVVYNGTILSLKRIKDDVREVESGYECGIGLENFNDVKVGDVIEAFKLVETKRKLTL